MNATETTLEPQNRISVPDCVRVYVAGKSYPEIRVPLREVRLSATKSPNGLAHANPPVRLYDCSGPWGDPDFAGDVRQGLTPMRRPWILARGDVEPVRNPRGPGSGFPGQSAGPLQAKPGKIVTQLQYARQGVV